MLWEVVVPFMILVVASWAAATLIWKAIVWAFKVVDEDDRYY